MNSGPGSNDWNPAPDFFQQLETNTENNMKKFLIGLMAAVCAVFVARAVEITALDSAQAAKWDATHVVTLSHEDLTDTNTATFAQTITSGVVAAKSGVELKALILKEPFNINTATTNAYNTTTLSVGDSASNTVFLTSTELNENGTEVYVKYGTGGSKVYTASNNFRFAFTGMTNNSLADLTRGKVELYFRVINSKLLP